MKRNLIPVLALGLLTASCSSDEPTLNEEPVVDPVFETTLTLNAVESRAAQASAPFDASFFQAVSETNPMLDNFVSSPLSARILLAMTANGSDAETAAEIYTALGTEDTEALNSLCSKYLNVLPNLDPATTLSMANSVWFEDTYHLKTSFADVITNDFGSECFGCALHTEATKDLINAWVADKTKGKIDKILSRPVFDETLVLMANALYFKGAWANPFDAKETEQAMFKGVSENSYVSMMHNKGPQHYAESDAYQAVRMDIGTAGLVATFVLPSEGTDINEFVSTTSLRDVENARYIDQTVDFYAPRFELNAEKLELNTALSMLGINLINEFRKSAVFEEDVNSSYSISQKATLEVTEKGAEGAAVTWNYMVTAPGPDYKPEIPVVTLDRPFVFYISHPATGAIIFAARVGQL